MPAAPHAGLLAVPDRLVPLLMRIDATGHVQTASERTVRLLGFAAEELPARIRQIGCRLSLNDLGTGYSCLAHRQRLPISTIKIDRSFVRNLSSDPAAGAMASAISALADALCMDCIAEGVETPEQHEDLVGRGVELLQGYLFSRPIDPDQFIDQYAPNAA